jgi:ABC-type Fe3+-hydroxamate transport system substrate-binding protein
MNMSSRSKKIFDARGRAFIPFDRPVRIISLVPSITELLFDLGLSEREVVGRTKFCIHPHDRLRRIPDIGGTKTVNLQKLRLLSPDLVIANIDENQKALVEELESSTGRIPVFVTHPGTIDEARQMISDLARLLGSEAAAEVLTVRLNAALDRIKGTRGGSALYLIWRRPYMSIAPGTYIHDMLCHLGYRNVIDEVWLKQRQFASDGARRYPSLTLHDIADLNPDEVLFSSEPFQFRQRHIDDFLAALSKLNSKTPHCRLVNGEAYSWYGSRLVHATLEDTG